MLEIKNNYLSMITLGSFNPAILTPDFLNQEKIFVSEVPPKGQTSPVVSQISFSNISLLVELERFQVMHREIDSFENNTAVTIMTNYLNVLKYTPISVEGINFNVALIKYTDSSLLLKILEDPANEILKHIDQVDEYSIDVNTKIADGKKQNLIINCKYYIDKGISVSINLRVPETNDEKLILNYNYEVQNIKLEKNRIEIIPKNYLYIVKRLFKFLEKLNEEK